MEKCKTCGKEFSAVKTMTYAAYGYCSWDCLMKKGTRPNNNDQRSNRRNNGHRNDSPQRSRWAQNY